MNPYYVFSTLFSLNLSICEMKEPKKFYGYQYGTNPEYFPKEVNINLKEYKRDQKDILDDLFQVGLIWKENRESTDFIVTPLLTNFLYGIIINFDN